MALHLNASALDRVVDARIGPLTLEAAAEIAKVVRGMGLKVSSSGGGPAGTDLPVRVFKNDDGTASTVLAHPSGVAQQARHGALTRAAAALGYEVSS